jgi:membrane protease YdiL (CAAX protease family)
VDGRGIIAFAGKTPEVFIRFLSIAAAEELVYRVAAQDMLQVVFGHPAPAIAISAAGFCLLHDHFFKNGVFSALEFVLFTLVISVLYYYTSSFTLVALMHLVRNLESAYLEYCVLLEDTHDEAEALRLLNARHASFAMESI